MKYYKNLYVGDQVKQKQKIRNRIRFNRIPFHYYMITFAANDDQLDIIEVKYILQPFYRKKHRRPFVIGIASSYDEALELVQKILEDTMSETGCYDMKSYIMGRM